MVVVARGDPSSARTTASARSGRSAAW